MLPTRASQAPTDGASQPVIPVSAIPESYRAQRTIRHESHLHDLLLRFTQPVRLGVTSLDRDICLSIVRQLYIHPLAACPVQPHHASSPKRDWTPQVEPIVPIGEESIPVTLRP